MAGRLLQQLLIASLTGAVTLIQMHDIPVLIRHQLHLDMLRLNDEFFHIDGVIPKICTGLRFRRIKGIRKLLGTIRTAHSASASSAACLDQHRISDFLCHGCGILYGFQQILTAGNDRYPGLHHAAAGIVLISHLLNHIRIGTDENQTTLQHQSGELRILTQKAKARMNRITGCHTGCA